MIRMVKIRSISNFGNHHTVIFALMMIVFVAAIFSILGCSESSSGNSGSDNTSNVEIEWLDPGPNEPVITYIYSGGLMTSMVFYQKFRVNGESGNLKISARIEEGTGNMDLLDEQAYSAEVESGTDYKISVKVGISGMGSCSPTDNDLMIFDSTSAPTTSEIYIAPTFDIDWNWWECVGTYSISEIIIQKI